jgi:hypothetical protein
VWLADAHGKELSGLSAERRREVEIVPDAIDSEESLARASRSLAYAFSAFSIKITKYEKRRFKPLL